MLIWLAWLLLRLKLHLLIEVVLLLHLVGLKLLLDISILHQLLVLDVLLELVLVDVLVWTHSLSLVSHLVHLLEWRVGIHKLRLFLLLHKGWICILLLLELYSLKLLLNILLISHILILLQLI